MEPINIIIPTRKMPHALNCIESLKYFPYPFHLDLVSEGNNWPVAINIGLKRLKGCGDVLLMDDDVELLPGTFNDFYSYYPHADIFGFKLLFPDGRIQHGGGLIRENLMTHLNHKDDRSRGNIPLYVAHVTASLIYIKRGVIWSIGLMDELPGHQFEDVDFNLRAFKYGYKIMYIPNEAIHGETETKKNDKEHKNKMAQNYAIVYNKHLLDRGLLDKLETYPRAVK